jgi:hypothetical protein
MLLLALSLLAFGTTDIVGGRPTVGGRPIARFWTARGLLGVVAGVVSVAAVAACSGYQWVSVVAIARAAVSALLVWSAMGAPSVVGRKRLASISLAWVLSILLVSLAISSVAAPIGGPLADWYHGLEFGFAAEIPVGQFVLGCAAFVFALATGNRLVVDALALTDVTTTESHSPLKGGRFLGPMERIIVGAVIVAGDPAAAAIVIAAKGFLRFPEIRGEAGKGTDVSGPDENTEYFLIGTFSSLIIAAGLAVLVSASG